MLHVNTETHASLKMYTTLTTLLQDTSFVLQMAGESYIQPYNECV